MKLLKDWELDVYYKAQEAIKNISADTIAGLEIHDLNETNLAKIFIDNVNTFVIKWQDGIRDVIIKLALRGLSYRSTEKFLEVKLWIVMITLIYFSEERWNITDKIKYLLTSNIW